jgi:hypothetical protein
LQTLTRIAMKLLGFGQHHGNTLPKTLRMTHRVTSPSHKSIDLLKTC